MGPTPPCPLQAPYFTLQSIHGSPRTVCPYKCSQSGAFPSLSLVNTNSSLKTQLRAHPLQEAFPGTLTSKES